MKIRALHLGRFKGFVERTTVPIRPITLLYGANSAGKSSILQALMLLKQSVANQGYLESSLEFRGPLVDLGGFAAAVSNHDVNARIDLGLAVDGAPTMPGFPFGRQLELMFRYGWDESARQAGLVRAGFRSRDYGRSLVFGARPGKKGLYLEDESASLALLETWTSGRTPRQVGTDRSDTPAKDVAWVRTWLRKTPTIMPTVIPVWSPSELAAGRPGRPVGGSLDSPRRSLLQRVIFDWQTWSYEMAYAVRNTLEDIHYIGPLREAPRRIHVEGRGNDAGIGVRGERAAQHLARDERLLRRVNLALEMLEVPYEVLSVDLGESEISSALGEIHALALKDRSSGLIVTPGDVGFGVSQILPVILQLLLSEDSLICIEQPEIHLHPRLQSRLGDIVVASMMLRRNQVLIETHSEHLLLRLQRRVRDGSIDAKSLATLFVGRKEGGGGYIERMELDSNGNFEAAWPHGFFDDRLEDLLSDGDRPLSLDPHLGA